MSRNDRPQKQLILCFQLHQPRRLKRKTVTEEGHVTEWLDEALDQQIMQRVAQQCYLPVNTLLLKMIAQHPQIKVSFSMSGLALEQLERYAPEALDSFKALAATGNVDFIAETYYNSLAFLMESEEFEIQILEHTEKIVDLFGIHPWAFRNTGLLYNDDIGRRISMMGFQGVITEGHERALRGNPPGVLYEHRDQNGLKIFFRNPGLSTDIAYHAADPAWDLSAAKFMSWLENIPDEEQLVTLGVDYETFGEHRDAGSGVVDFLENWLLLLSMQNDFKMTTPAEVLQGNVTAKSISIPDYVAISNCELSHWLGNDQQREAFGAMVSLEPFLKERKDPELLKRWRFLQASDHFYYMSTQGDRVPQFSPFESSQEAFEQYMRTIEDLSERVQHHTELEPEKLNNEHEAERRSLSTPTWAMAIDPRSGQPS